MSFADKLIQLRKQKHISQEQLSARSGLSQSAISAIERGTRTPIETTIIQLSKALGVDPRDMIDEKKDPAEIGGTDNDLIFLLSDLEPEEVLRVRDFVAGIKASRGAKSSHQK